MIEQKDDPRASDEGTLIDALLQQQQTFTAVERFSQKHAHSSQAIQSKYYQDLIPIRKPSTGEQYAFEVDMDKCTGCKACVVACHSLNGLKESESWRDIGTIRGSVNLNGITHSEQQTITSACHHCLDPACLSGCPVGAYEKIEETGVVKHLDDQCIGCQYCSLKCPYDVPKYDADLGIVRKCDMCHERLAEGEAPACVQSCPNGAISIQLVDVATSRAESQQGGSMVAGAFRSDYTLPTTRFRSTRKLDHGLEASDEKDLTPAHNHAPLVWMLMLTQAAVGISSLAIIAGWCGIILPPSPSLLALTTIAVVLGNVGLCASLFHLGSPLGAWRVFLGLKTSWLSREIILFGAWMPALMTYAGLLYYPLLAKNLELPSFLPVELPSLLLTLSGAATVALGLLSVFCSIMVYVDTKRAFWSAGRTSARFLGTTGLSAFAAALTVSYFSSDSPQTTGYLLAGFLLTLFAKIATELSLLKPARSHEWSYAKKSALIQLHSLRNVLTLRWTLFLCCLLLSLLSPILPIAAVLILPLVLAGESLERRLFFQAVVTLKMPGELNKNTSH